MFRAGTIAPAAAAPSHDAGNRRLVAGLLVSLLLHALILSLQFGVPGMALQGARSAIDVTLAPMLPPVTQPQSEPVAADPVPPGPPAPVTGMRLVDPVARPAPPPPLHPAMVRKDKPRKARRISTPLPQPEADAPVRVIAQASNPASDFVVPLPQPEESVQKTIDPAEAQRGSDDVAEVRQDEAPLPELAQPLLAQREAEAQLQKAADEERIAAVAARDALAQQRQAQENAKQQELAERLFHQRRAQELAERQKSEELLAQQRRQQELSERKKLDEQLARQRLAQELAERQRQEELAARRLAEERARNAQAPERGLAQARAAPAGDPFGAADGQGAGGGSKAAAGNHGSNLANRVRELSKGLDLLTGAPPVRPRADSERQQRRVVVDNAERDVPLRMYVESWRQKIERNGGMNFPRLIGERARIDPLVSVAVRSDGSIEDVTIVRSSGRQDTDEAVRRIVRLNALYSTFPPNIASRYDVIEIRRIWTFDQVLKLIEEVR
ncbi:cell envelope integrity protein TolA [Massilia sp. RP-1-19]|uniref:Cell envelope integrity protein TolA n=1 Tax=Massilia polaris TaxID=2728846 RepID=A0A848HP57_9BURK|nr:cell envelope integrity protein TolA [Massilia polaris]NML61940.1 cell envelope integrity protein TolA [Massilia polaris]